MLSVQNLEVSFGEVKALMNVLSLIHISGTEFKVSQRQDHQQEQSYDAAGVKVPPLGNGQCLEWRSSVWRNKKTNEGLRHELWQDVLKNRQEHLAHSDNSLLATTARA